MSTFHPSSSISAEKRKRSVDKYGDWWKRPPTMRYKRAGVIPITIIDGQMFFFLGRYEYLEKGRTLVDLSDFGGGVKTEESFILAAKREFEQESGSVFPIDLKTAYCHDFYDEKGNIVSKTFFPFVSSTYIKVSSPKTEELKGSQWVSETEFMALITNAKSWKKQELQLFIKVAIILEKLDISKIKQ